MARLEHAPSGIPGFDLIANGGFVRNRSTLVADSAGSGKTIFGVQFLIAGAREMGENGVMVTFEESPGDIVDNVANFGWDMQALIDDGRIAMIDATPPLDEDVIDISGVLGSHGHALGGSVSYDMPPE